MASIFTEAFLSNVMKSAAVAGATALLGICANAVITTRDNARTLNWHTAAIQKVQEGQVSQAKTLQDVDLGIVRLEGKIDTLNQKIDDAEKRELTYQPEPHHWVASK
jgi:peptidoglycan hydrolase CwlO-like protein